jgi:hypothetical protein
MNQEGVVRKLFVELFNLVCDEKGRSEEET